MQTRILVPSAVLIFGLGIAATGFGHAGFKPKDHDPLYSGRAYKEGTTAYLSLVPSHGCRDESGVGHPTRDVYTVFPNAEDLSGVAYTEGRGERFAGNALMSVKPESDSRFASVERVRGSVPEYYSHGTHTDDVRALRWRRGLIPDDMYAELKFRAVLPRLDGCVETLRVYMPTVQYCTRGLLNAWIREPTTEFSENVISSGYAPYVDVQRDYDNNPLPQVCGESVSAEVYPSVQDVERYLSRPSRRLFR